MKQPSSSAQGRPEVCDICANPDHDLAALPCFSDFVRRIPRPDTLRAPAARRLPRTFAEHSAPFVSLWNTAIESVCFTCRDKAVTIDESAVGLIQKLARNTEHTLSREDAKPVALWSLKTALLSVLEFGDSDASTVRRMVQLILDRDLSEIATRVRIVNVEPGLALSEYLSCHPANFNAGLTFYYTIALPNVAFLILASFSSSGTLPFFDSSIQGMVERREISVRTIFPTYTLTKWPFASPISVQAVENVYQALVRGINRQNGVSITPVARSNQNGTVNNGDWKSSEKESN